MANALNNLIILSSVLLDIDQNVNGLIYSYYAIRQHIRSKVKIK